MGRPSTFVNCTKLTALCDAVAMLEPEVRILVISCMGGIINTMSSASDPKYAIEKAMRMLGGMFNNALEKRQAPGQESLRIFVAPSTPRSMAAFEGHCKIAVVSLGYMYLIPRILTIRHLSVF